MLNSFDFIQADPHTSRIFILGSANGSGNLGDEAMFEAITGYFNQKLPLCKVTTDVTRQPFDSIYPNVDRQIPMYGSINNYRAYIKLLEYFGIFLFGIPFFKLWKRIFPKTELSRYYAEFKESDLVVFSGAGAINSRFRSYGIFGWGTLVHLAKSMDKKVYFSGHGIGPFHSKIDHFCAVTFLKRADFVKCRDQISYELLKENGVKNCDWGLDDAYFVEILQDSELQEVLSRNSISEKFVVLSFHAWNKTFDSSAFDVFVDQIWKLDAGLDIVLLGNKIKPTMNDIPVLEDFKAKYATNPRIKVLAPPYTPQVSKSIISKSKLLITTRYHPAIFSGEKDIPCIAVHFDLYYHQKFQGAFHHRNKESVLHLSYQDLQKSRDLSVESLGFLRSKILND